MLKKSLFKIAVVSMVLPASARVRSISSLYFDEGKVKSIYLATSVPTLIEFPCNIVGSLKDVAGNIEGAPDKENPRRLVIWLKSPKTSTITVLCEKRVFVFKVNPSSEHQAFIKVLGSYGGPELLGATVKPILTSETESNSARTPDAIRVKRVLLSSEGKSR